MGYSSNALWDLLDGSIKKHTPFTLENVYFINVYKQMPIW